MVRTVSGHPSAYQCRPCCLSANWVSSRCSGLTSNHRPSPRFLPSPAKGTTPARLLPSPTQPPHPRLRSGLRADRRRRILLPGHASALRTLVGFGLKDHPWTTSGEVPWGPRFPGQGRVRLGVGRDLPLPVVRGASRGLPGEGGRSNRRNVFLLPALTSG